MIAAYCATYGPLPEGISYPRFLSMVYRVSQFSARATLGQFRSTLTAIAGAFSGGMEVQQFEDMLDRVAYPRKSGTPAGPRMALIQEGADG